MTRRPVIRPWVGADYPRLPPGDRVLLLGESMYTPGGVQPPPGVLATMIPQFVTGERVRPFFNQVLIACTGRSRGASGPAAVAAFWGRVALYNYVQRVGADRPGVRPTPAAWAEAAGPFRRVLPRLAPGRAVVFGRELAARLAADGFLVGDALAAGGWACPAAVIPHPGSFGFSARRWHAEVLAGFLAEAVP